VRIWGAILALALACAGCGKPLRAGKTPKETIRNLEAALQDLDLGAVYDMLSSRAQRELDASLEGVKVMLASIPEAQLKQAGLGGWKDLDTRDFLEAAVDRARGENPAALEQFRGVTLVVLQVKPYGDRATVKVCMILNGRDREQTIPMVREGGRWRIDTDDSVTALPVNFMPDMSDCTTAFT
jgi:hypothetical protein